jgi:hypothetical protein
MSAFPKNIASRAFALIATTMVPLAPSSGQERSAPRTTIAIADFDYADTSGEVRNQEAEHEARLRSFVDALRFGLEHDARYRIVALECRQPPCTAARLAGMELIDRARASGVRLLFYGGIQKMSTLVQYAKVQVIDLQANKLLFDRLISFRNDTDESWERAQHFLLTDLKNANLLSQ